MTTDAPQVSISADEDQKVPLADKPKPGKVQKTSNKKIKEDVQEEKNVEGELVNFE